MVLRPCLDALQWLWSMVTVALYRIHAKRSQAAFESLIKDWRGTLVSDDYGVYQAWGNARQSCLAHLVRRARELSQRPQADLAACGKVGFEGASAVVSDGSRAAKWWSVAGVVCALVSSRAAL